MKWQHFAATFNSIGEISSWKIHYCAMLSTPTAVSLSFVRVLSNFGSFACANRLFFFSKCYTVIELIGVFCWWRSSNRETPKHIETYRTYNVRCVFCVVWQEHDAWILCGHIKRGLAAKNKNSWTNDADDLSTHATTTTSKSWIVGYWSGDYFNLIPPNVCVCVGGLCDNWMRSKEMDRRKNHERCGKKIDEKCNHK